MPEYYLIPKGLIKRWPSLRQAAWAVEGWFFKALIGSARMLSPERAGTVLSWLFGLIGPHTAKAAKADLNLRFVLPQQNPRERRAMVKQIFRNLGLATAELLSANRILAEREQRFDFVTDPVTAALLAAQKPILFVTAHIGAWNLGNAMVPHYGMEASYLYAKEPNPWLHDLFYGMRKIPGIHLYPNTGGLLRLHRELAAGRCVGLVVDTRLDEGELIPLCGVPAPTNTLAARLALRTRVPLIPVRTERLPNHRYRITAGPPIPVPEELPDEQARAIAMTTEINRRFEQWIRDDPTQWVCLKRRWPKDAIPAPQASNA